MATDIILDKNTHDLDLSEGGLTLHTENTEVVSQRVKIALLLRKGDWYQNILLGVPYQQEFFVTKSNKAFIDYFLRDYVNSIPDVDQVSNYSSEITKERALEVSFSVRTSRGELITNISTEV